MKQFRNPDTIHPPLAKYTHQIEVSGIDKLLFISGQVGMDQDGNLPDDPATQLALALDNVLANLHAADMDVANLTKITFYLVDQMDAAQRRAIVEEKLSGHQPCMTMLYVAALAAPSYKVEVDAFAASDS